MTGRAAGLTKIAGGRDEPHTEEVVPDAIDHDAGQQGVVGVCHPLGKAQAPVGAAGLLGQPKGAIEYGGGCRCNHLPWALRTSAIKDAGGGRFHQTPHKGHGRTFRFQGLNQGLQVLDLGLHLFRRMGAT